MGEGAEKSFCGFVSTELPTLICHVEKNKYSFTTCAVRTLCTREGVRKQDKPIDPYKLKEGLQSDCRGA